MDHSGIVPGLVRRDPGLLFKNRHFMVTCAGQCLRDGKAYDSRTDHTNALCHRFGIPS
ncbi:hypothetical protein GCM10025778_08900 [Paeniglutamicibacter antarcticus]|uniref:Uncharacterized protein n=1 Tax=Paeniglutamicibacter antarcticus TaxID=494023 RepID=A0ABP9TMN8_9MICC